MQESLRVFIDESGVHDNSPVVTVAMYAGQPVDWRLFAQDWNAAKHPINIIHAVDCANRTGEFDGWDRDKRNAFAAKLLPVLPRHNLVGVAVGINLEHFRAAMAAHPELVDMVGTPYSACFQWAVQTFLNMMGQYGADQPVQFFHEHNDYEAEARVAFKFVQTHRPTKEPIALSFISKADAVELQAADVLAYEANHVLRSPKGARRPSWDAIDPDRNIITLKHYGEDNMQILVSTLLDFRRRALAAGWDGIVDPNG
ncbi:hypothetical protein V1290_003778 [Bradyrhizobium sp. AZCC 1578]|uniref:DUF3800 domain-containing protein n=1 Tax=Bradyrhizobium sp. AZCC 1578 TaxID=3117027 RepID=UPI002FEFFDF5